MDKSADDAGAARKNTILCIGVGANRVVLIDEGNIKRLFARPTSYKFEGVTQA